MNEIVLTERRLSVLTTWTRSFVKEFLWTQVLHTLNQMDPPPHTHNHLNLLYLSATKRHTILSRPRRMSSTCPTCRPRPSAKKNNRRGMRTRTRTKVLISRKFLSKNLQVSHLHWTASIAARTQSLIIPHWSCRRSRRPLRTRTVACANPRPFHRRRRPRPAGRRT